MKRAVAFLCCILTALILLATACGKRERPDYLAYQKHALHVEAVFNLDGNETPATVELDAPNFDDDGRMLARSGSVTLSGSSLVSGVSFEFAEGKVCIVSGVLKIPLDNESMTAEIFDMISLFCIDPDSYYESESVSYGGDECTRVIYTENSDSPNRVETILDSDLLPKKIDASLGDRLISVRIDEIKVEN